MVPATRSARAIDGGGDGDGKRRRGRGSERGEWERDPRGRGPLAPLSSPASVPARWSGGSARPCSDPVGGTGKGTRGGGSGLGRLGRGG